MKKILAFGASSSVNSINKIFANYSSKQIPKSRTNLLDLNDFEMPIFSIDKQKDTGIPEAAIDFKKHISNSDAVIISFAEHNGSYTSAFKNILDWTSRIERIVWCGKPMLLLSYSLIAVMLSIKEEQIYSLPEAYLPKFINSKFN